MPLWQLYQQWVNRKIPNNHCIACCAHKAICHDECNKDNAYCSEQCQRHYHQMKRVPELLRSAMHQFGIKRLLEPPVIQQAQWQWLPLEIQVAILELSFPLRETDYKQFHSLSELRLVSQKMRELIEKHVWSRMLSLPREFEKVVIDMEPFSGLERFSLIGRGISAESMFHDIAWPTRLQVLGLHGTDLQSVPVLPHLTELDIRATVQGRELSLERFLTLRTVHLYDVWDKRDTVFASLIQLPHLHQLTLMSISRQSMNEVSQLTRLTHLELSANVNGTALLLLTNLMTLKLNSIHPGLFGRMPLEQLTVFKQLHTLVLYETSFNCDHFQAWPALRVLDIEGSYGIENTNTLSVLTDLTELRIRGVHVSAQPVIPLVNLTRLDWQRMDPRCLYGMTQLTRLDASFSYITDEQLARLVSLRHLTLILCYHVTMVSLTSLRELIYLDITRCHQVDRHLTSLVRLPSSCVIKLDNYEPEVTVAQLIDKVMVVL